MKEKQIEEMAKDMCEYYYEGTCYQDKKPCDCKCEIFTDATYLYVKGYRKATDVAREIFEEIDTEICKELEKADNETIVFNYDGIVDRVLKKLKKKYTEVTE